MESKGNKWMWVIVLVPILAIGYSYLSFEQEKKQHIADLNRQIAAEDKKIDSALDEAATIISPRHQ